MSEPEPTDVEKLLRLKRYEKPSEEFLDRFMSEFQTRQRSEMLKQSAHGLFFERLSTWAWDMGRWKWVYAGGAASALAISGGMFLTPEATEVTAQLQNENAGVHQTEGQTTDLLPQPAPEDAASERLRGVKLLAE